MAELVNRYSVELHNSSHSRHKTWRVVRQYDRCIICVCVYKRGAYRVCEELNALASGKMGAEKGNDILLSDVKKSGYADVMEAGL